MNEILLYTKKKNLNSKVYCKKEQIFKIKIVLRFERERQIKTT